MKKISTLFLCSVLLLAATSVAAAKTAAENFADGQAKLTAGDLSDAYKAFRLAYAADKKNKEYRMQTMMLGQVIKINKALNGSSKLSSKVWQRYAMTLHFYFKENNVPTELVAIDKKIYEKYKSADTAILLAETLLDQGQAAEAVEVLEGLDAKKQNSQSKATAGIALAKLGKEDAAKKVFAGLTADEFKGISECYTLARLAALTGEASTACAMLTKTFVQIPPSRLAPFKKEVAATADFASIKKSDAFAQALAVKSEVKESACSGGSNCATCPSRGKCPTN